MRVGIIHKRQDSLQSSEWKATDVSMHLCFLIPGTQVLVHMAGTFLLILFIKASLSIAPFC